MKVFLRILLVIAIIIVIAGIGYVKLKDMEQ